MSDIEVVLCSKLFLEDFWNTGKYQRGEGRNGKMSYVSIFDIIFLIGRIDL